MAGRCSDDLDINSFYTMVMAQYKKVIASLNEGSIICVPHSSTLKGIALDSVFSENHILRPSPFFSGQFDALSKSPKSIIFDRDKGLIKTLAGYDKEEDVKVLWRESAYFEAKKLDVLIISKPLGSIVHAINEPVQEACSRTFLMTFDEVQLSLQSIIGSSQALARIDGDIKRFSSNYVILPNFLDDAAANVEDLIFRNTEKVSAGCSELIQAGSLVREDLAVQVETYIMGHIYGKVYPVVCEHFKKKDEELFMKCQLLQNADAKHLGLSDLCSTIDFSQPSLLLNSIDNLMTPLEKLMCLKKTLGEICNLSNNKAKEQMTKLHGSGKHEIPPIASDELIPLVVTAIISAKPMRFLSNLYLMENFSWHSISSEDSLSYGLTTFKASAEHVRQLDLPKPASVKVINSCDAQQHVSRSRSFSAATTPVEKKKAEPTSMPVRGLDRRLDELTRALQASSALLGEVVDMSSSSNSSRGTQPERQQWQPAATEQGSNQLGEFLAGIRDNPWSSGSGTSDG